MLRVFQPKPAALLDQVAAARDPLTRLMRLHRERIGIANRDYPRFGVRSSAIPAHNL